MNEINKNNGERGLVVAELINKKNRKNQKDETFYILEVSIKRSITEMILELRNETSSISFNGKEPFYVFQGGGKGNKYAYTLEIGCIYAFWFTKQHSMSNNEDYFHVSDWRKLSHDKRSIERSLRLALNRKEEEEEQEMTNRELLIDLKKRIKEGKITLIKSAVDSDSSLFDTDLKDNESNFRINLQEKEEIEITKLKKEDKRNNVEKLIEKLEPSTLELTTDKSVSKKLNCIGCKTSKIGVCKKHRIKLNENINHQEKLTTYANNK